MRGRKEGCGALRSPSLRLHGLQATAQEMARDGERRVEDSGAGRWGPHELPRGAMKPLGVSLPHAHAVRAYKGQ